MSTSTLLYLNERRREGLEPAALSEVVANQMTDVHMLCSIAISLKRLADAVTGDEHNTGIHRAILDGLDRQS